MKSSIITALLTAVVFGALPSAIQAQSTAFSYQGILTNGETPAEGIHDFEFRLFDADTDGTQIGTTITTDEVTVEAGLFTIVLDYGTVFDGSTRYLEIAVRPGASAGSYTELSPRQLITATPYAVRALEATTVPSGAITSAMLADRSITAEKISAPGEEQIPVSNGNGGISWMSVGDYLLSQNYNPPLPGIVENEAMIEISGVFVDVVQIVNGPGIEIEKVPSTFTESGLNAEFALVFDYDGSETAALQTWFDDLQSGSDVPRSGSIIVERTNGTESFRWNFFEYELTEIGNGTGGKTRYTLTHARNPRVASLKRTPKGPGCRGKKSPIAS